MDQQEANKLIAEKIEQAQKLVDECVAIANKTGVDFMIEFGGYGTGATYYPENNDYHRGAGWLSSSAEC